MCEPIEIADHAHVWDMQTSDGDFICSLCKAIISKEAKQLRDKTLALLNEID